MSLVGQLFSLVLLVVIASGAYLFFSGKLAGLSPITGSQGSVYTTILQGNTRSQQTSTIQPTSTINYSGTQSQLVAYALFLINQDRKDYGLSNVTLAPTQSGQQHSQDMLENNYFSHWDTQGMKPYMRYTLLSGTQSVDENIATNWSSESSCLGSICTYSGNLDPQPAIRAMEYSMMYNDSICCNNGHRDNILDPNHNEVSIGIAYNSSTIYFTEDFVNNYVSWQQSTPAIVGSEVNLDGVVQGAYNISSIEVSYDPALSPMSQSQLAATHSYSYGSQIAGVVADSSYYYQGIQTIVADNYQYSQNSGAFNIKFNLQSVIANYSAGEYTVMLWLNKPGGSANSSFLGATYTVFIDGSGNAFIPQSV